MILNCNFFRLGLQILKAIDSIHSVGFLHRDIKPVSNTFNTVKHAELSFKGRKDKCFFLT